MKYLFFLIKIFYWFNWRYIVNYLFPGNFPSGKNPGNAVREFFPGREFPGIRASGKIFYDLPTFPKINKIKNIRENLIKFKKTKNLLIIFETDSTEINCIFSKNNNPEKKEEDFCLFINKNEVHYHAEEKNKSNKKIKMKYLGKNMI